MKLFYENVPQDQVAALTTAITGEVLEEFRRELRQDNSARLFGVIETAILHELSKEKN